MTTLDEFKRQLTIKFMANILLDEDRAMFGDLPGHPLALTQERAQEMAEEIILKAGGKSD